MSEKLPKPDRRRISSTAPRKDEVLALSAGTRLARIHATAGPHPLTWDALRSFGPTSSRFDHHTEPKREHPRRAVAYVTVGSNRFTCALAEYFQDLAGGVGPVDPAHRGPAITQFALAGDLRLLDLDSGWTTRAGGNQAITSGPRRRSREWAKAIYAAHADLHGLTYRSSVWGPGRCIVLWERGRPALPPAPLTSRLLSDPAMRKAVVNAADQLGTYVV